MNAASRIHKVLISLKNITPKTMTIHDAYKIAFNVNDTRSVYKAITLFDKEVSIFENMLKSSNKKEKYKDTITLLRTISMPLNIATYLNSIENGIDKLVPLLEIFADAYETHITEEADVSEKLKEIQKELDSFLEHIQDLDIDNTSKLLYAKITLQLKESISFYEISGISDLNLSLQHFKCITNKTKEANSISEKLSKIVGDTANVSGLIGFTTGASMKELIEMITP